MGFTQEIPCPVDLNTGRRLRTPEEVNAVLQQEHGQIMLPCLCIDDNGYRRPAGIRVCYNHLHPGEPYVICEGWDGHDCHMWGYVHQLTDASKVCVAASVLSGQATVAPASPLTRIIIRCSTDQLNPKSGVPTWSCDIPYVAITYQAFTGKEYGDVSVDPAKLKLMLSIVKSLDIAGTRLLYHLADLEHGRNQGKPATLEELLVTPPVPDDVLPALAGLAKVLEHAEDGALTTPLPSYKLAPGDSIFASTADAQERFAAIVREETANADKNNADPYAAPTNIGTLGPKKQWFDVPDPASLASSSSASRSSASRSVSRSSDKRHLRDKSAFGTFDDWLKATEKQIDRARTLLQDLVDHRARHISLEHQNRKGVEPAREPPQYELTSKVSLGKRQRVADNKHKAKGNGGRAQARFDPQAISSDEESVYEEIFNVGKQKPRGRG